MSITTAINVKRARLGIVRDSIDSAEIPGMVNVYKGSRPDSPATPPVGATLIATMVFGKPCGTILDTALTIVVSPGIALIGGECEWARILDGDGNGVVDITVGDEIIITPSEVVQGGTISVQSFVLYEE